MTMSRFSFFIVFVLIPIFLSGILIGLVLVGHNTDGISDSQNTLTLLMAVCCIAWGVFSFIKYLK